MYPYPGICRPQLTQRRGGAQRSLWKHSRSVERSPEISAGRRNGASAPGKPFGEVLLKTWSEQGQGGVPCCWAMSAYSALSVLTTILRERRQYCTRPGSIIPTERSRLVTSLDSLACRMLWASSGTPATLLTFLCGMPFEPLRAGITASTCIPRFVNTRLLGMTLEYDE